MEKTFSISRSLFQIERRTWCISFENEKERSLSDVLGTVSDRHSGGSMWSEEIAKDRIALATTNKVKVRSLVDQRSLTLGWIHLCSVSCLHLDRVWQWFRLLVSSDRVHSCDRRHRHDRTAEQEETWRRRNNHTLTMAERTSDNSSQRLTCRMQRPVEIPNYSDDWLKPVWRGVHWNPPFHHC